MDSRSVHAFIVGEHGDSEVVVWSSANVSGVPLSEMCEMRGHYKHKENTAEIATAVKNSACEIIKQKARYILWNCNVCKKNLRSDYER